MLDRWTILRMKARLSDEAQKELELYESAVAELAKTDVWKRNFSLLISCVAQLSEANGKTWITEASIRQEYDDDEEGAEQLSLEEIGRRTLKIRSYNKLRVDARNAVNVIFGHASDEKVEHPSR